MSALTSEHINVIQKELRPSYRRASKVKFRVEGRKKFVQKTFNSSYHSQSIQYLPTSSYYSVVDAHTNETVIPFDTSNTKLSLDYNGNYFNLWMDQFESERYYKLKYQVERNGIIEYFDNNFIFRVVD